MTPLSLLGPIVFLLGVLFVALCTLQLEHVLLTSLPQVCA